MADTILKDQVRPKGMGRDFNRLWAAAIATNLGDGLARTAAALIAVTLTDDPFLISVISALAMVPWLLFAIAAGGVVDRVDRRKIMAVANAARVLVMLVIVALILFNQLTIWWLYLLVLVFGVAETFADNANTAMVPQIVGRSRLMKANSRIQGAQVAVDNFIATPISGLLFAVTMSMPLWFAGAGYFVAGVLIMTLPLSAAKAKETAEAQASGSQRVQVTAREAFRFLLSNKYLLWMNITTCLIGFFFAIAQATNLLYFISLGLPLPLIGVATSVVGVGALIGALVANTVITALGAGRAMLGGLMLSGAVLIPMALFHNLYGVLAFSILLSFGISVWNVAWGSLRQIVTPDRLQGRLFGISRTLIWGMQPAGYLIGGALGWLALWLPILIGGCIVVVLAFLAARLILSSTAIAAEHVERTGEMPVVTGFQ